MILSEVTYDSNNRYRVGYTCHGCGKRIADNRFEFCPFCGVGFMKVGRPERIEIDQADVCALIAFAITNGGFEKSGLAYMNDGQYYKVERPDGCGMVWAAWKKEILEETRKDRKAKEKGGKA